MSHRHLDTHSQEVFWVDSGSGGDVSNAGTFPKPFATLDYAIGRCTASQGDIIYVKEGHSEALGSADQIDADVAGISIIGLGNGDNRPLFDFTHADGSFTVGADDILIENLRFHANVTGVTQAIECEAGADDVTIRGCHFDVESANTDEFLDCIFHAGSTGNNWLVEDNVIDMALGGAQSGINLNTDLITVTIRNNVIRGDYAVANIEGSTTLSENVLIEKNTLIQGEGGAIGILPVINLVTSTDGVIRNNKFVTQGTVAGGFMGPGGACVSDTTMYFGNTLSSVVEGQAVAYPAPTAGVGIAHPGLLDVKLAVKAAATDETDNLFDVALGSVVIHALFGIVDTDADSASTIALDFVGTVAADNFSIATVSGALTAANSQDMIYINGADNVVTLDASPIETRNHEAFICPIGVITSTGSGTAGGLIIDWFCYYSTLDKEATLAASA